MTKQETFKKAHELAKSVHQQGECYRATFGAALKLVIAESKALVIKKLPATAMHIEYAADAVIRCSGRSESYVLEAYADDEVLLLLIDEMGSEKACSIAKTVREIKKAVRSHRRVTAAQRHAIAKELLDTYKTAQAALAAAYGVTEAQFMAQAGK